MTMQKTTKQPTEEEDDKASREGRGQRCMRKEMPAQKRKEDFMGGRSRVFGDFLRAR